MKGGLSFRPKSDDYPPQIWTPRINTVPEAQKSELFLGRSFFEDLSEKSVRREIIAKCPVVVVAQRGTRSA